MPRQLKSEDLYKLQLITSCQISPDGRHVVYALQRIERKTEKKFSNLWIVPTNGGGPIQFTQGNHSDSQPQWSPDGTKIAFLSNRGDENQPQLYVIPFHGGEAIKITDLKGSFGSFEWAPDSRYLVLSFRKKDAAELERDKDEQKKKLGITSRHYTRTFYKLDGEGYLPHERWHLWTVDTVSKKAKQVTPDSIFDETQASWSPDGKQIVYCTNRAKDPDHDPDAVDLCLIAAKGGKANIIPLPVGRKSHPVFAPNGKSIAYVGVLGRGHWWKNEEIWITTPQGKARSLTAKHDITVTAYTLGDMSDLHDVTTPVWSSDSQSLLFQTSEEGRLLLRSVDLKGRLSTVAKHDGAIGSFSLDRAQRKIAYFMSSLRIPADIYCQPIHSSEEAERLTFVNEAFLKTISFPEVQEIWFKGKSGNRLQGWVMKPVGAQKGRRYPTIVEIHGGPLCQYGYPFMFEFNILAAHGYAVAFSNPRGGIGYGVKHAKAIWQDWGNKDYSDIMSWTDAVEKLPFVDRKRIGVTGGSYGGFMTNWIIGHTQRFKAAVTQRSVSNFTSAWGSSDFNWIFEQEISGGPPWLKFEKLWKQSPMKYIGKAKTPTLVTHSEMDFRCDQEQGEQIYVALKRLGVPTELVLFPESSHGVSRNGRTDRRIARLNHIAGWFNRYLK